MQKAAIEEQMQNARENPLAAAAAAAAASGAPPPQANAENLLDIDFDGAAPASAQKEPSGSMSGLEGLAGTPQRIQSPVDSQGPSKPPGGFGGMDDLMGLSNGSGSGDLMGGRSADGGMSSADILGGFASMDMSQPPPPMDQLAVNGGTGGKKTNEDLLGLF